MVDYSTISDNNFLKYFYNNNERLFLITPISAKIEIDGVKIPYIIKIKFVIDLNKGSKNLTIDSFIDYAKNLKQKFEPILKLEPAPAEKPNAQKLVNPSEFLNENELAILKPLDLPADALFLQREKVVPILEIYTTNPSFDIIHKQKYIHALNYLKLNQKKALELVSEKKSESAPAEKPKPKYISAVLIEVINAINEIDIKNLIVIEKANFYSNALKEIGIEANPNTLKNNFYSFNIDNITHKKQAREILLQIDKPLIASRYK